MIHYILALMFRVTVLIQQIFNFLLINFCPIGPMEMQCVRSYLSHETFPIGFPFPWTSLKIVFCAVSTRLQIFD